MNQRIQDGECIQWLPSQAPNRTQECDATTLLTSLLGCWLVQGYKVKVLITNSYRGGSKTCHWNGLRSQIGVCVLAGGGGDAHGPFVVLNFLKKKLTILKKNGSSEGSTGQGYPVTSTTTYPQNKTICRKVGPSPPPPPTPPHPTLGLALHLTHNIGGSRGVPLESPPCDSKFHGTVASMLARPRGLAPSPTRNPGSTPCIGLFLSTHFPQNNCTVILLHQGIIVIRRSFLTNIFR